MPNESALPNDGGMREAYKQTMLALATGFEAGMPAVQILRRRSDAIDGLVTALWQEACATEPRIEHGISLIAVGGYGRRELFPCSDVDLMILLDNRFAGKAGDLAREPIQRLNQSLWDCGLRVSAMTRRLSECEKFDPDNAEFALALLDRRIICGDAALFERLDAQVVHKLLKREGDAMLGRLAEMTAVRHAKYGRTLFHLEPNIKDCPGGLRDVNVCGWVSLLLAERAPADADLSRQAPVDAISEDDEFQEAVAFLQLLRCFLHLRHERDNNTLDWRAQDAAAAAAVGLHREGAGRRSLASPDPAYWMRLYFRNARIVDRRVMQMLEDAPLPASAGRKARVAGLARLGGALQARRRPEPPVKGLRVEHGAVLFDPPTDGLAGGGAQGRDPAHDPAHDPETVLRMFEAMSRGGYRLGIEAERRLAPALPLLSADLEEGPALWRHIEAILCGPSAGTTLRAMHALGILELLIPEFHGIDALVIRDAYHRYTVDEHTFVLIDTLHELEAQAPALRGPAGARSGTQSGARSGGQSGAQSRTQSGTHAGAGPTHPMAEWASRFGQLLRDLQQPGLLYLVALLHDTGKGRSTQDHARESVRMAENVLSRLELDGYESSLVLRLIASHLEMSAALRRDIFDTDTVRAFAAKVQTPEALRMLTLFTYADIQAVHPDALTPWKAENLWRLYLATSNYLERNLDEDRVVSRLEREQVLRVIAMAPSRKVEVEQFLEGLPARYLSTRTPEQVRAHFELSTRFGEDRVQLDFSYSPNVNEMTLVTPDRPLLFATMAGALAAWGMNIIAADAFSNQMGVVVDSFRFTDAFRTLEMNASERQRFVQSVHDVVAGKLPVETLLLGRRRGRRRPPMMQVEPRVDFDDGASSHSTLLQVVAQDTPGLLRALSLTLAASECNVDVALVDTEGETAIDVFYLTRLGAKLTEAEQSELRSALLRAIDEHGRQGRPGSA